MGGAVLDFPATVWGWVVSARILAVVCLVAVGPACGPGDPPDVPGTNEPPDTGGPPITDTAPSSDTGETSAPLGLTLFAPTPGQPDRLNEVWVRGASAGASIQVLSSATLGTASVPECPNLQLGLGAPAGIGLVTADEEGEAVASYDVPSLATGKTEHFQAYDIASCAITDVVSHSWTVPSLLGSWDIGIADAVYLGEAPNHLLGVRVEAAGDADGSGWPDLILTAPWEDSVGDKNGAVYISYDPLPFGMLDVADADAEIVGHVESLWLGAAATFAGDVNGDDFDDILIGAWNDDSNGNLAGAAYLFYGPVYGALDTSAADAKLVGESAEGRAGYSVAAAGDLDADGYDDIVVGALLEDGHEPVSGTAYVVYGPIYGEIDLASADAVLRGVATDDRFGASVAGVGDIDGDGYDDIAIGAHGVDVVAEDAGAVYVFRGPVSGAIDPEMADIVLYGAAAGDEFGASVASTPDLGGDGLPDLLIGAWNESTAAPSAGAGYVMHGPFASETSATEAAFRVTGELAGDQVNKLQTCDVNGDGTLDLVAGTSFQSAVAPAAGAAYVVYGPLQGDLSLSAAPTRLTGQVESDELAIGFACNVDLDRDGFDDLVIGAEGVNYNGGNAGAVYVVYGR